MGEWGVCGSSCLRRSSGRGGVQIGVRGGCVPYCVRRRRWCSLRYWNRRVRRCLNTCVSSSCLANNPNVQPEQQASLEDTSEAEQQASLEGETMPEMTVEDLDTILAHITSEVQRLAKNTSSSSSSLYDTLSHWEQRKDSLTTFMKSLPNQVRKEVVEPSKDLFNNLLIKVIGGAGQVHWLGLGLSIIAWSLENINCTRQNYKEGLEVLEQTIRLLRNTKEIWQYIRDTDGSASYERDLRQNVEKAFDCAIICTANLNDNHILRFLNASSVQGAMTALKEDLTRASDQNVELMVRYKLTHDKSVERQPVYSDTHDKDKVGGVEVANEAMAFLKQDCNDIIAVLLHGMGGAGKSFIGFEIFRQIQTSNSLQEGIHYKECMVELAFGIEDDKLIGIQKQIVDKVYGKSTSPFSSTRDGRQTLQDNLKKIKEPIFLYLDNILEPRHLSEVLPKVSCFPPNSRILVTSRLSTLIQAGIESLGVRECNLKPIEVRGLQEKQARELLWNQIRSIEKHKDDIVTDDSCKKLEEEVLQLCGGLPLALKVVGGYIASDKKGPKDARIWQDVLHSMQKAQGLDGFAKDELFSSLILFSIENLAEGPKKAFLDLVSFCDVDDSWRTLKCLVGRQFMKALKERALVQKLQKTSSQYDDDDDDNEISTGKIHDLLRAIGKKMIQEDKNELRISGNTEFGHALHNGLLERVVALEEVTLEDACLLKRMPLLRFLKDVQVMKGECPDAQLPHLALVQSETGNVPFNFRECASLKAVIWGDRYIETKVNPSNLEVLRHEKISKGLEILRIFNWPNLENVDAIETFGCLRELVISHGILIKCMPEGMGNLTRLRELRLEYCWRLQCLPKGITSLTCLKRLSLQGCYQLQSLPEGISVLQRLQVLRLRRCTSIRSLGDGIAE